MSRNHIRIIVALGMGLAGRAHAEQSCEALKNLSLADTTITAAETHAAGTAEFAVQGPPGMQSVPALKVNLPGYCRVTGSIKPTSDSDIRFELWLPLDNWNHRYQQVGNGGLAGSIPRTSLISPLQQGWAVAGTDDGHVGQAMDDGRWALGHPEKIVDFGYRAVHLTAVRAKEIVQAFYRAKAEHAYFAGCSDGGREGLIEAQRYPEDFDGFLVGAPALNMSSLSLGALNRERLAKSLIGSNNAFTAQHAKLLSEQALARCDAQDGVKDGVIGNPQQCSFKPRELLCANTQTKDCLNEAQVQAVEAVYNGLRDAKTGKVLAVGHRYTIGTEPPDLQGNSSIASLAHQMFSMMVYNDPKLNFDNLDLAKVAADSRKLDSILNATDANLSTVKRSGKKIIQYHGWADPAVPADLSLDYFAAVQKQLGNTENFYRLFMVPGMGHCGGGTGATRITGAGVPRDADHDALHALTRWVESGIAPDQIIATEFAEQGTDPITGPQFGTPIKSARPICSYPQVAKYTGQGSTGDAANFECKK